MKANFIKAIGKSIVKHERIILTGLTIVAEGVALYQAIKQGPKFKEVKEKVEAQEITKKDAAKELAIPAAKIGVPFLVSAGSAVLNHKKASDTIASLANLYTITRTVSDEYKSQVEKEVDAETLNKINEATGQAMVDRTVKFGSAARVYHTGHGDTKFYDKFSDRYFYSDANYLQSVVNDFNERLNDSKEYSENNPVLLSELYSEWGLPYVDTFEHFMWDHDTGLIRMEITPAKGDDNQFYGVIGFKREPRVIRW